MHKVLRSLLQFLAFGVFAMIVGYLSASPAYTYRSPELAAVKLSLSHAADRVAPCVRLTPREIAELAPNMRQAERCERERLPLTVQLVVDGQTLASIDAAPSGLWNDGPASIYETFEVSPGRHTITARLRDTARAEGWDYALTEEVSLDAGRYFTVTFSAETGGFRFR